jgi:uncharacterized protein
VDFEWDEGKNELNLANHGFDFADAAEIFDFPMLIELDDRRDYGEERWIAIGLLQQRIVAVVYTEPSDTVTRIISLRKALSHERKRYEQYLKN